MTQGTDILWAMCVAGMVTMAERMDQLTLELAETKQALAKHQHDHEQED